MIDRREIVEFSSVLSLEPRVIEKDWVLGWVLAGISANPALAQGFVFKGGTCLKKCYFETYRFSEDLDFTIIEADLIDQAVLSDAFTDVCDWVYQQSGIETFPDRLRFDVYTNPRGGASCEGRFSYRGPVSPRGDPPRIKLDLTADETLVMETVVRHVAHPYSDGPADGIQAKCYAFEEVFGEKVRALGERCRPRDLYDVVHLYRRDESRPAAKTILEVLSAKCAFKGISLPDMNAILDQRLTLDADWEHMLAHQLQALPPVEAYWQTLRDFFTWLTKTPAAVPPVSSIASTAGAAVRRGELGGGASGFVAGASNMETVFFAAANRMCVDLRYKNRVRRVEPYSLRRTSDGHLLLYAARAGTGEIRCYRVDQIQDATVSRHPFNPRFTVELTDSGQSPIPRARKRRTSTR